MNTIPETTYRLTIEAYQGDYQGILERTISIQDLLEFAAGLWGMILFLGRPAYMLQFETYEHRKIVRELLETHPQVHSVSEWDTNELLVSAMVSTPEILIEQIQSQGDKAIAQRKLGRPLSYL